MQDKTFFTQVSLFYIIITSIAIPDNFKHIYSIKLKLYSCNQDYEFLTNARTFREVLVAPFQERAPQKYPIKALSNTFDLPTLPLGPQDGLDSLSVLLSVSSPDKIGRYSQHRILVKCLKL